MKRFEVIGEKKIVFRSRLFDVLKQPVKIRGKDIDFEFVRRPPGVRLLVVQDKKILISKELRFETSEYDYRVPGGRVFDNIEHYTEILEKKADILPYAEQGAKRECLEEAGIKVNKMKHIHTTAPSSLIIWDLYYFLVDDFEYINEDASGVRSEGEVIQNEWKDFEEVKQMCLEGKITEERTVAVLLRFLFRNE